MLFSIIEEFRPSYGSNLLYVEKVHVMQQQMKKLMFFNLGFLMISGRIRGQSICLTLEAKFCYDPLFPLVLENGAHKWKKYRFYSLRRQQMASRWQGR